ESALNIQSPTDHLGIVFFDHEFKWLKEIVGSSDIDGLKVFSALDLAKEKNAINGVSPRGSTSIGGGLQLAAGVLAPAVSEPNRKVVLLMTDGLQNTNPLVQVTGTQVQTTNGGSPVSLPNQPPIQVSTVTVGTDVTIPATIMQDIANASNGLYFNTQT